MRAHRLLWQGGALAAVTLLVAGCGGGDSNGGGPGDGGSDVTVGGDSNSGMDGPKGDQSVGPDSPQKVDSPPATFTAGSVLEHHLHPSRDGLYTDPRFTKAAAAALKRDMAFAGMISGAMLGQPLYGSDVTPGKDAVFVATEGNDVYSLDGKTGAQNWMKNLGPTVALSALPCGGGIDPYGVTGTPIIDPASRTIYLESMSTPDGGMTEEHRVFAMSVDDGSIKTGWPVKIDGTTVPGFDPHVQHDRGALALLNGILYLPFTGLNGDCGQYHGWIIGIDTTAPTKIKSWATGAAGGGAWGTGGVASDGTSLYLVTGNTFNTGGMQWTAAGGEAVVRFQPGPVFSGQAADYFAPSNWIGLDNGDTDLGSSAALLIDVPGATPSALVVAGGKSGVVHLIDRTNMGGVAGGNGTTGEGVFSDQVIGGQIKNAAAAYSTTNGFYVVVHGDAGGANCPNGTSGDLVALKIAAAAPPTFAPAWCANSNGVASPIVTTTDGHANAIVWITGATGDNKLYGFDGDTGATVFGGGGANEQMANIQHWTTPMEAKGHVFVGATDKVYSFVVQ
jgi:hypothetical protein